MLRHDVIDELYIAEPDWKDPMVPLIARWGTQAFYSKSAADLHINLVGGGKVTHWIYMPGTGWSQHVGKPHP